MYRDDLEALQARLRTLDAELEAERSARKAAEAGASAARAAADEARLEARRSGGGATELWPRVWPAVAVAVVGLILAWTWISHDRGLHLAKTANLRAELEQQTKRAAALQREYAELERQLEQSRARAGFGASGGGSVGGSAEQDPDSASGRAGSSESTKNLSRAQIQQGFRRVKEQVQRCYDRFQKRGQVRVRLTINRDGVPSGVTVRGAFQGTPTGRCVAQAVKQARFSPFTGQPLTIAFPFILR